MNKIKTTLLTISLMFGPALAEKAQGLTFTYGTLLDQNDNQIQKWSVGNTYSAHLTDSGTVWYAGGNSGFGGGGGGGSSCASAGTYANIYEVDWNGKNIRTISASDLGGGTPHHAFSLTSKGTVLAIVAESYNGACGERLVEYDVNSKKVIWSWHTNDHQGSGATKLQRGSSNNDPYHANNVDWDEITNRVVFSAHNTYEIYVIDRSIDSTQAKTTAGDILWRFGNPSKYGVSGTQYASSAVHSARWVKPGVTGAGNIIFYANISPANSNYSTGYEIKPIYSLKNTGEWDYEVVFKGTNGNSKSQNQGGIEKIFNGNWLITYSNDSYAREYSANKGSNQVLSDAVGSWKASASNGIRRYPLCYGAIATAKDLGHTAATNHYNNYCVDENNEGTVVLNNQKATSLNITVQQNMVYLTGLATDGKIAVYNLHGKKYLQQNNSSTNMVLNLQNLKPGIYVLKANNHGETATKTFKIGG